MIKTVHKESLFAGSAELQLHLTGVHMFGCFFNSISRKLGKHPHGLQSWENIPLVKQGCGLCAEPWIGMFQLYSTLTEYQTCFLK